MTEIQLKNIVKHFDRRTVLNCVNLTIEKGQRWAIIGPSAAGKSVLLKLLAGLHAPDGGQVLFGPDDFYKQRRRKRTEIQDRIGMLFQQNALFDSLPNWENIAFKDIQTGQLSRPDAKQKAMRLLTAVGLPSSTADLFPADLSGGMQKRVGLARAIASNPDILLLDNPTAGLDPVLVATIEKLIKDHAEKTGSTVLTITGEMENLTERYTHIAVMHQGRLHWCGPAERLRPDANPYALQMLAGSPNGPIQMTVRDPHRQSVSG